MTIRTTATTKRRKRRKRREREDMMRSGWEKDKFQKNRQQNKNQKRKAWTISIRWMFAFLLVVFIAALSHFKARSLSRTLFPSFSPSLSLTCFLPSPLQRTCTINKVPKANATVPCRALRRPRSRSSSSRCSTRRRRRRRQHHQKRPHYWLDVICCWLRR